MATTTLEQVLHGRDTISSKDAKERSQKKNSKQIGLNRFGFAEKQRTTMEIESSGFKTT